MYIFLLSLTDIAREAPKGQSTKSRICVIKTKLVEKNLTPEFCYARLGLTEGAKLF